MPVECAKDSLRQIFANTDALLTCAPIIRHADNLNTFAVVNGNALHKIGNYSALRCGVEKQ